jgi:hypothetical protein
MFMGTCIVSVSNKMQRYTVYLYLETALHVFMKFDIRVYFKTRENSRFI